MLSHTRVLIVRKHHDKAFIEDVLSTLAPIKTLTGSVFTKLLTPQHWPAPKFVSKFEAGALSHKMCVFRRLQGRVAVCGARCVVARCRCYK